MRTLTIQADRPLDAVTEQWLAQLVMAIPVGPGGVSRSAAIRQAVLEAADLIGLDAPVRILAQTVRPATVRSLDAIHLGTALHARQVVTSFVTYDKRQLEAALAAGLPAEAPA